MLNAKRLAARCVNPKLEAARWEGGGARGGRVVATRAVRDFAIQLGQGGAGYQREESGSGEPTPGLRRDPWRVGGARHAPERLLYIFLRGP